MFYFDMDGVLARWKETSIEETFEKGFFSHLSPDPLARSLILTLWDAGIPVSILTSVYSNGTAKEEKTEWLKKHGLGQIPVIFAPYGLPKANYIPPENEGPDILIDDFTQNLREWEETSQKKRRRVGVKYYNGINGKRTGAWDGFSISHLQPVYIAAAILSAVERCIKCVSN